MDPLFRKALRIRKIEEAISRRYSEQEMRCPVHLSIGQEMAAVQLCEHLKKTDLMVSTHRAHAHYLAKGGSLRRMIAELYGKRGGCSGGHGGSMHLTDRVVGFIGSTSIVASTIPVGVGLAFADKYFGRQTVTAVCLGDAALEEGVFHEAANFAALHKLAVIFYCENNGYSCDTPLHERQPLAPFVYRKAQAHGISVYAPGELGIAIKYARDGHGPVFVEVPVRRQCEHCGPSIFPDDELNIECHDFDEEIENAFAYARRTGFPRAAEDFTYAADIC